MATYKESGVDIDLGDKCSAIAYAAAKATLSEYTPWSDSRYGFLARSRCAAERRRRAPGVDGHPAAQRPRIGRHLRPNRRSTSPRRTR